MMKDSLRRRMCLNVALLLGVWGIVLNCTLPTKNNPSPAVIKGRILVQGSSTPVEGALVEVNELDLSVLTDSNGNFSLSFELPDSGAHAVTLVISKTGFRTATIPSVVMQNDKELSLSDHHLVQETATSSGPASNIILVAVETSNIFVKGTGGNENSDLTFEVRDASGAPIDLKNKVTVTFTIKGGPGGSEFLSPTSAESDSLGRVSTTINSGTIAGALQIIASITGLSIASAPVPIAIHGGLPDLGHFAVVPNKLNFAGYNIFGLENTVTAFVGDRYSNPVPPGTAVQFQSTGGIIGGSAVTDRLGRASVTLLSANPRPQGIVGAPFPFNQAGFASIVAQTVNEKQEQITTSTVVLFSGVTQVEISPTTFSIPPLRSQIFQYKVSDQNGNPLVAGTNIQVASDNGKVGGVTNFTLEDTQSRAFTIFSFALTNSEPDSFLVKDATVTIEVTSQNGNVKLSTSGQMLPIVSGGLRAEGVRRKAGK